ncbi:MAG: GNAT family N-acetyltransferase, partial [Verrucomicrobiota bacterium]
MKNHILITKRLKLIPFTVEDEALCLSLNQDAFIRKYLWDDEVISPETSAEILRENQSLFGVNGYGLWKIMPLELEKVIGYTGLWYFFGEPQPQLIYTLLKSYTKRGYATEAGKTVIRYAFENLGFTYLIAATDESHMASQAVAKR